MKFDDFINAGDEKTEEPEFTNQDVNLAKGILACYKTADNLDAMGYGKNFIPDCVVPLHKMVQVEMEAVLLNYSAMDGEIDPAEIKYINFYLMPCLDPSKGEQIMRDFLPKTGNFLKSKGVLSALVKSDNALLSQGYKIGGSLVEMFLNLMTGLTIRFMEIRPKNRSQIAQYYEEYLNDAKRYIIENHRDVSMITLMNLDAKPVPLSSDPINTNSSNGNTITIHLKLKENVPNQVEETESCDLQGEPKSVDALLGELNSLIGLQEVKQDVASLINLLKIRKIREERGLTLPPISLHLVFSGNPGTGKTTVARLLAQIYKELGILSKGHLVEVDRSKLVGGYVGQTAIKVQDAIQSALGGVLFIDEAYSLVNKGENDYGTEAIDTLVKGMEDNRADLVVIVAGYPDLMEDFLNANPGLRSRFNKFLYFADYSAQERLAIFESMARKSGYGLTAQAADYAGGYFEKQCMNADEANANARGVRNFFEKAIVNQANRLAETTEYLSDEDLMTITLDDLSGIE